MVEDLKGKIRVYCRIKPKCGNQLNNKTFVNVLEPTDDYTLIVHTQRGDKEFTFDRIFLPQHTQEEVFTETNSLVQSAMDGYNVCIFAYGQTGSGKTYTLTGNSNTEQLDAEGIAPRAFRRIFDLVRGNEEKQDFVVTATFLELYNERFIDLLRNDGDPEEKLEVRKDSSGHTYVPGATVEEVSNSAQLLDCFVRALGNRRLSLVDLAGSERLEKSGLEGNYIRETNSINKSLSALGDVIHALAAQQSHVPYRNNKLTMLMQDSIGGSAKTLMFVNVSSDVDNVEESVNSLVYATRVRQITNDVVRASETKEIAKLKSGWHDVSYHGSDQIPTPNIDVLAMDGIILFNNYVQPLSTPTRAALLTGLYPIHTGTQRVDIGSADPIGLSADFTLLPQHLRDLGYSSHMVGKWHLGFCKDEFKPTKRGFDTFYGIYNGDSDYWTHFARD
ncbi:hypothetical protein HPB47_025132, partial [Ixodes persulcatus]